MNEFQGQIQTIIKYMYENETQLCIIHYPDNCVIGESFIYLLSFHTLYQRLANYGPWSKSCQPPVFVNTFLLDYGHKCIDNK